MGKVSIGLRGWRFDEEEVFTENGEYRPMDDMDEDTRTRLFRLSALVGSPCHACWLIHGDENIVMCNEMDVVYGEPLAEIGVCSEHETDFLCRTSSSNGSPTADAHRTSTVEWSTSIPTRTTCRNRRNPTRAN
jgi:hypothetical protein